MPVIPLRDSAVTTPDDPETRELDDAASQFRKIRARLAHVCTGYVRPDDKQPDRYPRVTLNDEQLTTYWFGPTSLILSCRTVSGLEDHGDSVVLEALFTMPGFEGQGFAKRAMRALLSARSGVRTPIVCKADNHLSDRLNIAIDGSGIQQNRLVSALKQFGFTSFDSHKSEWLIFREKG